MTCIFSVLDPVHNVHIAKGEVFYFVLDRASVNLKLAAGFVADTLIFKLLDDQSADLLNAVKLCRCLDLGVSKFGQSNKRFTKSAENFERAHFAVSPLIKGLVNIVQ